MRAARPLSANALAELIGHLAMFESASVSQWDGLAQGALAHVFGASEVVLSEGDESRSLFIQVSGLCGVYYSSPEAAEVLVKLFGAPAVFGEMELFHNISRLETVRVLQPAEVVELDGRRVLEYLQANPQATYCLLADVAGRLCIAASNERSLTFLKVETRVANTLIMLMENVGKPSRDGIRLSMHVSYSMLARWLGVSLRSIERSIQALCAKGILARRREDYVVLDPEALRAQGDAAALQLFTTFGMKPRHTVFPASAHS